MACDRPLGYEAGGQTFADGSIMVAFGKWHRMICDHLMLGHTMIKFVIKPIVL